MRVITYFPTSESVVFNEIFNGCVSLEPYVPFSVQVPYGLVVARELILDVPIGAEFFASLLGGNGFSVRRCCRLGTQWP